MTALRVRGGIREALATPPLRWLELPWLASSAAGPAHPNRLLTASPSVARRIHAAVRECL